MGSGRPCGGCSWREGVPDDLPPLVLEYRLLLIQRMAQAAEQGRR